MDLFYRRQTVVYRGPGFPTQALFLDPLGEQQGPFPVLPTFPPSAEIDLSSLPRRDGIGELVWRDGSGILTSFPVALGQEKLFPDRLDLLVDLAQRLGRVWVSEASDGSVTTLLDPTLQIGGSAEGLFLLRLSGLEAGASRRVFGHEGPVLSFDPPFETPILPGDRYALLSVSPAHLEQAIEAAHRALAHTVRVEQVLGWWQVPEEEPEGPWEIDLPKGWEAVFRVWARTGEGKELSLPPQFWNPIPGRKLLVRKPSRLSSIEALRVIGFRSGIFPVLPRGEVEGDALTLLSQAAVQLFLSGAGGPAIDPEDRMRKAVFTLQEATQGRVSRRNRVPTNAKLVQE